MIAVNTVLGNTEQALLPPNIKEAGMDGGQKNVR